MTNVVQLQFRPKPVSSSEALAASFAAHRRGKNDVFWLKENAEFLNIHQSTGASLSAEALAQYDSFYETVENQLKFFPQYYRFLLSITLDLEDIGMPGNRGAELCEWVHNQGLVEAELSDLQRAEAQRLLLRRIPDKICNNNELLGRLNKFICRKETFSLPNKKAAYELTHIIFYLSAYGQESLSLPAEAVQSLMFTGTLAFIDENADLLAEVCIALAYAEQSVPEVWQSWLSLHAGRFVVTKSATTQDDYHEYLMCNWFLMNSGKPGFEHHLEAGEMSFFRPQGRLGVLRDLSEFLYERHESTGPVDTVLKWPNLRSDIAATLDTMAFEHIQDAEKALPEFEEFFAGFSRSSSGRPT
ncbi:hypothetical protein KO498_11825 [Lentibacter algarum]|uniref:DUF6902 family protein n=1 Tax=Lentibacter algarum TaxID=576131 RepID=UPI001C09D815|nr:hypothetical protein [Lentibacter algarum]MBU2982499.1 hypothetical protein [Lentibacter algarum]